MEPSMGKAQETPSFAKVSTKQRRIAELAERMPGVALSTLAHHIDLEWLREAYRRARKDGAVGIDNQGAEHYVVDLEENLRSLLNRAKSGGGYWAPPVRRVHVAKGEGSQTRPIGIPTFEVKLLQRAVLMVLEPFYEQEFLDCSYGFRPGRSAHGALGVFWRQAMAMGGGWLLEIDIESFFDSVDKKRLLQMLRQRVCDSVLLRLIGKWLKAGLMEEGCVYHPETGTSQGGVLSPLLVNVFLHEVLGVLPKRFERYALRLHPERTRLVSFRRPEGGSVPPSSWPGTFDLLGFTHYWGRSRKGNWVVKRKTARTRFSRALCQLDKWLRAHRHWPVRKQLPPSSCWGCCWYRSGCTMCASIRRRRPRVASESSIVS